MSSTWLSLACRLTKLEFAVTASGHSLRSPELPAELIRTYTDRTVYTLWKDDTGINASETSRGEGYAGIR